MKVEIFLKGTSQRIKFEDAKNAYTEDVFYCVHAKDDYIYKYPINDIFNIKESY